MCTDNVYMCRMYDNNIYYNSINIMYIFVYIYVCQAYCNCCHHVLAKCVHCNCNLLVFENLVVNIFLTLTNFIHMHQYNYF